MQGQREKKQDLEIKRGLKGDKTVGIIIVIMLSRNTGKVTRREVYNYTLTSFHCSKQKGYGVQHIKTAEDWVQTN